MKSGSVCFFLASERRNVKYRVVYNVLLRAGDVELHEITCTRLYSSFKFAASP